MQLLQLLVVAMGAEVGTLGGGAATIGTGMAKTLTFNKVPALNQAFEDSVKYTEQQAKRTKIRHGVEALVSGTETAGLAVGAGLTFGQVDSLNRAVVASAERTMSSGQKVAIKYAEGLNPINLINDFASIAFTEFTTNLPRQIRRWLGACAADCYYDDAKIAGIGARVRTLKVQCVIQNPFFNVLKAVVYEENGKTCLAIKGTDNPMNVQQCISLGLTEASLEHLAACASSWAQSHQVDYVTGHSLGGFLAEAVASRLGKDGAAFQSPGGRGALTCFGNNWSTSTQFEVNLATTDPVSNFRIDLHIAEPAWHTVGPNPHGIENMLEVL